MQSSDVPAKFQIPFANAAGGSYIRTIPKASQIGVTDGAASLTDGFVPLNATPVGAGGVPPSIKDMNGILKAISAWSRWAAAGGTVTYDATFAAAVGGYPKGAVLASAATPGLLWISTAENNTTDPDSVSASGWTASTPAPANADAVRAGTSTQSFVTPASLRELPQVIDTQNGVNGYRKWSDGFIEQWGDYPSGFSSETTGSVSFTTPFSSVENVWNISITKHDATPTTGSDYTLEVIRSSIGPSGFSVQVQSGSPSWGNPGAGFSWRAVGA